MSFSHQKQQALSKQDYSAKGSIDSPIVSLLNAINALDSYYTTSSCSGRIVVLDKQGTKLDSTWLFVSHHVVKEEDVLLNIEHNKRQDCWFLLEPPIVHVCCKATSDAKNLLQQVRDAGWKRSGIISMTDTKIIVEIAGTERIQTPLHHMTTDYARTLIACANDKLTKGHQLLEQLEKKLKK